MKKYTEDELKLILDKHRKWLLDEPEGEQANLRYANLRSANLRSADLSYANLSSADLSYANLSSANLRSADLRYANLSSADLSYANLSSADLRSANLRYANLSSADLRSANLSSADLSYADLSYANLSSADLSSANLRSADLRYADLSSADLSYANLSSADLSSANLRSADDPVKGIETALGFGEFLRFPQEGEFIAFKKVRNQVILKVKIPADADRVNAYSSKKGRASKVITLAAYDKDRKEISGKTEFIGTHDGKTRYVIGEETLPDSYDPSPLIECSHGIHFFLTFEEAKAW
jgi:hypothetical protein